jgi:hypothetical protein
VELELKLHSSNDAFGDDGDNITAAKEVARILRVVAYDIEVGTSHCSGKLKDINGNTVGSFEYDHTLDDAS